MLHTHTYTNTRVYTARTPPFVYDFLIMKHVHTWVRILGPRIITIVRKKMTGLLRSEECGVGVEPRIDV